jgi:RimJ/RimL family protein N-acetyltransferase
MLRPQFQQQLRPPHQPKSLDDDAYGRERGGCESPVLRRASRVSLGGFSRTAGSNSDTGERTAPSARASARGLGELRRVVGRSRSHAIYRRAATGQRGSWARLLRYAGHWVWLGYGFWVAEEKSTGKFVGELGYANLQRDIQTPLAHMPELGWVLATSFHGKGYASEAGRAATAWGDQRFGSLPTTCIIDPDNVRSIRVAQKCGLTESRRARYQGQPTIVFTR